ncbi:MAG: pilus assembly protein PilM [Halofilum sp. (in: g-proteobacteria)]|nr:pilus assembly protein PilM [Halofilum sp. (in: g-proteobacteria)]
MFLLKPKQPPILGVDISSTSVKLLELSRTGRGFKVESHAVEPLPQEAVSEKAIQDIDAVGEAIRKAVKKSGTKAKEAAVAVPGSAVITKMITMPAALSEDDMEGQIQLEADQYIPYPLEEINLDFEVMGPSPGDDSTVDVLLAASKSENVEMRSAVLDLAGLKARAVDVEPYTIEHVCNAAPEMLPDEGVERTVAVIDVGATVTSLNVIDDLNLIYTREQPFGGKQLTEEIMRRYGLSYEEAGRVKKQGGLPDNYEPEVLEPFKTTMAHQVSRFLQFFFSSSDYDGVDQILLAGGCASIPGVDEFIESHVGTPTTVANPFANMGLGSRINRQRLMADAPSLMIACGLAARGYR